MPGRSARSGFGRPARRTPGRFARPGRGRGGGRGRYADAELIDPLLPVMADYRPRPRGQVARMVARGYARWVMAAPDTRGLGTGLTALYPAGQLAHHYATGPHDPLLLGAFAPPVALAAWVATYKTHGSPRYSGAIAAIAAGVPTWLATAAATGVTNLSTLLGYTVTASAAWSAYTWSDVLKERRRFAEAQAKWETIAGLAGLEGSRLLRTERTRTGVKFKIDLGVEGPSAAKLERGDLAEQIARCYGIGADAVRITSSRKNARIAWITIQLVDLWSQEIPHPAVTDPAAAAKGHRSILDGPFIIGTDPETGEDLELVVFDEGGARHVEIVATNGGAKTNTLSNIVQQGAECYDVLTIAIDLGKGVITTLWKGHLHEAAGVGEEDKALQILDWIDILVDERAIACAGGTHQPTPAAPVVLLAIDEQDTATGLDSPIAHRVKPVLDKVHRRGRSGGVVGITAKQRNVVQHTGTKEGSANTYTKIVGRVSDTNEMRKAVPDWETLGCPDMSTYGSGAAGVVLLVRQGGTWQTGRTRALYDPDTVKALADAYGPADAHLEPQIAAALPGYAERHPIPATTSATRTDTTDRPAAPGATEGSGSGGQDPVSTPPPTGPSSEGSARGGGRTGDDGDWGFDPADDAAVDEAARGLVERLDEFIAESVPPPEQPTRLEDLNAARKKIDNNTVPEPVVQAVTAFLAERGTRGARRDELVAHLKLSKSRAAEHLGALRANGVITSAGNGKAARYYLPEHTPDDHSA
ncbi:winged helix-turn-helix domain-containing protein [Actinomadura fibrosa]|uniref:Winged helix-turn-helix domain-containing protein n=1 Tax=Actinomadura fibrosa TaxID=111802 RepID=A0ABW2XM44_9ACTN|nr:winged helix-turn-helix domain-containing protein [Actinomadura fibrosa]